MTFAARHASIVPRGHLPSKSPDSENRVPAPVTDHVTTSPAVDDNVPLALSEAEALHSPKLPNPRAGH